MCACLRIPRARALRRISFLGHQNPQRHRGWHWSGGGESRRSTESPTGLLDVRKAEFINSQYLKCSPKDSVGEKSMDAGAELLVTKPLKQTSVQSKKREASWTSVTESPISNRMSVPFTRHSEIQSALSLSLSHTHTHTHTHTHGQDLLWNVLSHALTRSFTVGQTPFDS